MRILASPLALALALCTFSGCTAGEDKPTNNDTVWLTIGADAIDAVNQAMVLGLIDGRFQAADRAGKVSVLEIPSEQLADLTRLMHDQFHRCGGYIVHDSLKSAVSSLDNERAELAATKMLVNYTIDNATAVQALLPALDQSSLLSVITHLSTAYTNRYHTTQNGTNAAVWIRDTWQGYINASGRTDASVELVQHSSTSQPSVVLTITGDTLPNEVVVIGGHLDSTAGYSPGPSTVAPGADDDASGVATVSEVARTVLTEGFYPDRTVKFMAYAAEEVGLRGSGEIAADYASQGINVVGVMQLDMTNYQGSNEDIVLINDYTNAAQNAFIGNLIDTYLGLLWGYSTCGYGCSDHASWHNQGFAASIPFESLFNDYNPYIHSSGDTLANSDPAADHSMKFASVAIAYLAELAKGDFTDDPTPPDPPPPTGNTLTKGVPVNNLSGATGSTVTYTLDVPAGSTNLTFNISGGSGDADMYVKFGSAPTTSSYDCRPYETGNNESCSFATPSAGTWYVMIRGYSSYSGVSLVGDYSTGGGGCSPYTNTRSNLSGASGSQTNYSDDVPSCASTLTISISGGSGDADLYVKFGSAPTTSSYNCRPYKSGNNETCTFTPPQTGTYYIMLRGYTSYSGVTLTTTYQ